MSASPKASPKTPVTTIRDGKDGRQRVRVTAKTWGPDAEDLFLDTLAASCNVALAASVCGFSKTALYARRRRDPAFADRWQSALEQGYAALEAELLLAATSPADPDPRDPPAEIPAMTVREKILILQLHRAAVRGGRPQRYDWRTRQPTLEELRHAILRRLDPVAARLPLLPAPDADR